MAKLKETAQYQNDVAHFVQREVHYCISGLISELAKEEKYSEELTPVLVQDDWQNAAQEEGWAFNGLDKFGAPHFLNDDGATWAGSDWRELCEAHDIDPQQTEAYEHWIVSNWLADKLEAHGEMVLRDFMGIDAIWGRACTGQSISMDSVICDIYNELHKE